MATYFGFDAYDVEKYSDPFVFISYKSEDWEQVAVYARYLHDHGINVWYDNGLHAGSDWESYLMTVIERPSCKAVLLFVSSRVADSTIIPLETTQARACKKPTVAVYLEPGLDLDVLLNKAIKVYVQQRQSVNAYEGNETKRCTEVLEAARKAMENIQTVSWQPTDELWNNARMFLMNARRSRSGKDVQKARGYLEQMTENTPADYRGWLGLAMCECLLRVVDLDSALTQLKQASENYSYVMSANADAQATHEYTQVKSELWEETLELMELAAENCQSDAESRQLRSYLGQFEPCLGHTEPHIRRRYENIMETVDDVLNIAENYGKSNCKWLKLSKTEVQLIKYTGTDISFEIPAEIDGRRVTDIGVQAFKDCTHLVSVVIPGTVKKIETAAFDGCTGLKSVTMGEGVEHIVIYAFRGCTSLEAINIPESVKRIGGKAFLDCSSLTEITIPDGVERIGSKPFMGCRKLTVRATGGLFSAARKAARKSRVKYQRIKRTK